MFLSDDTDVFVLLFHHYVRQKLSTGALIGESPVKDRVVSHS